MHGWTKQVLTIELHMAQLRAPGLLAKVHACARVAACERDEGFCALVLVCSGA